MLYIIFCKQNLVVEIIEKSKVRGGRRHSDQVHKPPQLAPFNIEQWFYSELPLTAVVHPKMKIHSISTHSCADVRMSEDL